MRRRDFMAFAAAATMWPLAVYGQTPLVIGLLSSATADEYGYLASHCIKGLRQAGYAEGQNLSIEYRWADDHPERLPALAADLIHRHVTAIVAFGGSRPAIVAKAMTNTIPIVFVAGADPIKVQLVASLNQPGGNVTGVTFRTSVIVAKRLDLLREMVPKDAKIAVLVNPTNPEAETMGRELAEAERSLDQRFPTMTASNDGEIKAAFEQAAEQHVDAIVVGGDPLFNAKQKIIIALAKERRLATIFDVRDFAVAGGLMSYGPDFADAFRQAGIYTARILGGARAGDLPVLQESKYELVINLRTARALGLTVPPSLLVRADEVIE